MSAARRDSGTVLAEIEELEVRVEKLVAGGDGMARYEGLPIFVPLAAPGDLLRVRIVERRPGYGRAEILEVLEGGADRREPPCPYFADCGGCNLQHLSDESQADYKAAAVRETLERIGGVTWPDAVEIHTGDSWGYRLRTQLHVEAAQDAVPRFGYHARGSRRLVPVERCPVLVPELEEALGSLPEWLGDRPPPRIDLTVGGDGRLTSAPRVGDMPSGEVSLTVGDFTYRYDARCFFQAHRGLVGELVTAVVGEWSGEMAFDLYAGVGLFTLPLTTHYESVLAVEGDRVAARAGRKNLRSAGVEGAEMVAQAVESWVRGLPRDADRIVVDPPRQGLAKDVTAALIVKAPERLTYVSCHAATLGRDLRYLGRGYRLESLHLFDLFPQTGHMETVAQLTRA